MRKDRLRTSILVPSVRIRDIRDDQLDGLVNNDSERSFVSGEEAAS